MKAIKHLTNREEELDAHPWGLFSFRKKEERTVSTNTKKLSLTLLTFHLTADGASSNKGGKKREMHVAFCSLSSFFFLLV